MFFQSGNPHRRRGQQTGRMSQSSEPCELRSLLSADVIAPEFCEPGTEIPVDEQESPELLKETEILVATCDINFTFDSEMMSPEEWLRMEMVPGEEISPEDFADSPPWELFVDSPPGELNEFPIDSMIELFEDAPPVEGWDPEWAYRSLIELAGLPWESMPDSMVIYGDDGSSPEIIPLNIDVEVEITADLGDGSEVIYEYVGDEDLGRPEQGEKTTAILDDVPEELFLFMSMMTSAPNVPANSPRAVSAAAESHAQEFRMSTPPRTMLNQQPVFFSQQTLRSGLPGIAPATDLSASTTSDTEEQSAEAVRTASTESPGSAAALSPVFRTRSTSSNRTTLSRLRSLENSGLERLSAQAGDVEHSTGPHVVSDGELMTDSQAQESDDAPQTPSASRPSPGYADPSRYAGGE